MMVFPEVFRILLPSNHDWTTSEDGLLYIRYRERKPGPGAIVTRALATPYYLKVLSASPATGVRFERIDE